MILVSYHLKIAVFVPKHPVINPSLSECLRNEELFNYEELIDKIVDNVMTISIDNKENNEFSDLL